MFASLFDQLKTHTVTRLYSVILARIFRPLGIDFSSLAVSHRSGEVTLRNIQLDVDVLNSKLPAKLCVAELTKVSVRMLKVRIHYGSKMKLSDCLRIETEGVRMEARATSKRDIHVAADPDADGDSPAPIPTPTSTSSPATPPSSSSFTSRIAIWVDVVLSRMCVSCKDVEIVMISGGVSGDPRSLSPSSVTAKIGEMLFCDESESLDLDLASMSIPPPATIVKLFKFTDLSVSTSSSEIFKIKGNNSILLKMSPNPIGVTDTDLKVSIIRVDANLHHDSAVDLLTVLNSLRLFDTDDESNFDSDDDEGTIAGNKLGNQTLFESATYGGISVFALPPPPTSTSANHPSDIDFNRLESILDMYSKARTDLLKKEAMNGLFASFTASSVNDESGFYSAIEGGAKSIFFDVTRTSSTNPKSNNNTNPKLKINFHILEFSFTVNLTPTETIQLVLGDVRVSKNDARYIFTADHCAADGYPRNKPILSFSDLSSESASSQNNPSITIEYTINNTSNTTIDVYLSPINVTITDELQSSIHLVETIKSKFPKKVKTNSIVITEEEEKASKTTVLFLCPMFTCEIPFVSASSTPTPVPIPTLVNLLLQVRKINVTAELDSETKIGFSANLIDLAMNGKTFFVASANDSLSSDSTVSLKFESSVSATAAAQSFQNTLNLSR